MTTDVSEEHPLKAELPILVTASGILIEDIAEQPENVAFPILVTEFGMLIDVIPEHPRKE
jgi:hypothetical protein